MPGSPSGARSTTKTRQNLSTVKRIAELYDQKEDHQSSLQWYEYAYSLSGGDTSLQAKVQHLRERIDDLNLQALKQEIEANPDAPDIEQKRESLDQLRHARVEKQIVSTRERVEKNPTDLQLRFELGAALYAGGQFSEAIQELQKAKHNPNIRTRSMLMLARCYEKKGIYDLAVRQLTECAGEIMAMDTVKKEVLYFMGQIYEKMGQAKEALDAFKQIYEVDYGYLDVAQRVEASYT